MAEEDASAQEVVSFASGELLNLFYVLIKELEAAVRLDELVVVDTCV